MNAYIWRWLAAVKKRWSVLLVNSLEEVLVCTSEAMNVVERYAVAVMKEETILNTYPNFFLKYVQCSYEEEVPYAVQ